MTGGVTLEGLYREKWLLLRRAREADGGGTITSEAARLEREAAKVEETIALVEHARSLRG